MFWLGHAVLELQLLDHVGVLRTRGYEQTRSVNSQVSSQGGGGRHGAGADDRAGSGVATPGASRITAFALALGRKRRHVVQAIPVMRTSRCKQDDTLCPIPLPVVTSAGSKDYANAGTYESQRL